MNEAVRADIIRRLERRDSNEEIVLEEQDVVRRERNRAEFERHFRIRLGEVRALHLPDDRLSDAERDAQLLRRAIIEHRRVIDIGDHDADVVAGWLYAALQGRWAFPIKQDLAA